VQDEVVRLERGTHDHARVKEELRRLLHDHGES
jgi:hypothetical protein